MLARIHATFWERIDDLPDLFHIERPRDRGWLAVKKLTEFIDSMPTGGRTALEATAGPSLSELRTALAGISPEHWWYI